MSSGRGAIQGCLCIMLTVMKCLIRRGRREGGRLGLAKKFKTPFFKRYFKILSRGYSNGSRTSSIFFLFRISQQIWLYRHPKFWPLWAMAGRLIEQEQFFFQICTNM